MQYARAGNGKVWEAAEFAALPAQQLDDERRNLICVECGEFAWFRKPSTHGHPAHFCAHHTPQCNLRVEYVIVGEPRNEASVAEGQVTSGDLIVVDLGQEIGGNVDVTPVQPPPTGDGEGGGRTYLLRGADRQASQHFTLRRILLRLVQSPDFRHSDRQIRLNKADGEVLIQGAVRDIVASFDEIRAEKHNDALALYWGPISTTGRTPDGKLWLNSSDRYSGASVVVFEDIVEDFLQAFDITDLDDLAGAHVLVAGRCTVREGGRPFIWCSSPKYIIVRRYRDERLQAQL
ncbi:hypothetical protein KDW23_19225 [Burkholderia cenocepacia]|uniref:hypothetical protein n=1 Tax=Burkholderia cenocepacia TaxID=95486 RepID=UPI001B9D857E|nr:hypothetical protein [Burkholderia cenocepacia]MBR8071390.1 hypothetical protein [Burkholderia cenocepacia]MBR8446842.1 hypothetical protein [Burkholderia cenocepacia]